MKKRAALERSKSYVTNENYYKHRCQIILFEQREEVVIAQGKAYLKNADKEEFFMDIEDEKKAWYKIWCRLEHGW